MAERDDAVFLAGFVVGTYDLRGDATPPAYVMSVIERIMNPAMTVNAAPRITGEEVIAVMPQEKNNATVAKVMKVVEKLLPEEPVQSLNISDERDQKDAGIEHEAPKTDEEKIEAFIAAKGVTKERKPWSDEAKKTARQRALARGLGKKKAVTSSVPEKAFVTVSPDKLINKHNGYVGKRDPGQELMEEDWPDIDIMYRKKRMSVTQISDHYETDFETMRAFIDKHTGG